MIRRSRRALKACTILTSILATSCLAAFAGQAPGAAASPGIAISHQIVRNPSTAEKRYLVIAPGDATTFGQAIQVQMP